MTTFVSSHFCPNPEFGRLYIFGAGGHGREIAWLAWESWGDAVELQFVVDRQEYVRESVNGFPVILLRDAEVRTDASFIVALGDPALRRAASDACIAAGHRPATLVHPRAEISRWVMLGEGVVLCAGSIVTTNVTLGSHVHVNVGCTISHDVEIGSYSNLSPGVRVSGNVRIGEGVFIGTSASVINGRAGEPLVIEDGAVVAAGACVTGRVEAGTMVAGVPAIRKR